HFFTKIKKKCLDSVSRFFQECISNFTCAATKIKILVNLRVCVPNSLNKLPIPIAVEIKGKKSIGLVVLFGDAAKHFLNGFRLIFLINLRHCFEFRKEGIADPFHTPWIYLFSMWGSFRTFQAVIWF